ncbi:hypothetical protein A1O1_08310 [Capronia coronata CBS 617.96]|uniref:Uncharacterized protein n=1 Tax=Capronia coronata CBS 617.96 TaxID=1182541 RepID=W9XIW8_9EURO|nr:uncharacterized protein A1O1_08310 [Capronia coronata CBS 617.96]EXJ80168.1 hypothetical protein A1O1_08310 [Capronia coronata CBS 617.96]
MSRSPLPCRDANCRHGDCSLSRQNKQLEQRVGDELLRANRAESKRELLKTDFTHLESAMKARDKENSGLKERIASLEASLKETSAALEVEKTAANEIRGTLRMVNFNKEHQLVMAQQALALVNKIQLDKAETLSEIIQDYLRRLGTDINLQALPDEKQASNALRTPKRPRSAEPVDESARKQSTKPRIPPQREKVAEGGPNGA